MKHAVVKDNLALQLFSCEHLAMHLWHISVAYISLRDHVLNVVILNRCNTFSKESQLQGRRIRWIGPDFRMPCDELPNRLLSGEVKRLCPTGCPRSNFIVVALCGCQNVVCCISRPYSDAQDRLRWKDKTCPASTWLIMSWKAFKLLLIIMRRAFSRQHLLAKDPNWIRRTDLTIQQGGWVPCLQGTSAAVITAAVRKEYCLALWCCLPQHMTQSELGARALAHPSPFLRWHVAITAVPREEALELHYLLTDTSTSSQLNWSLTLRLILCQCKAHQQLSKLSGINTVAWLR